MSESKEIEVVGFQPAPREEWTLLSQGAEAKVWKLPSGSGPIPTQWVCKERFVKAYRHPDLDARLTKSRCRGEARVLEKCIKKSDLRVPKVIRVDPPLLYLEYLDGPSLKLYLKEKTKEGAVSPQQIAQMIGETVAKLHNLGVVHGDLTTSNIIVLGGENANTFQLVLIDFGLAKSTSSVEEQAVDLYVLERALESTHPGLPDNFFDMVLESYATTADKQSDKKFQQTTLQRLGQVRQRGRKRECFG